MKVLFTGDVNFRGIEPVNSSKARRILQEVQIYFDSVDFVVANLECPLANKEKHIPIKKSGPNLICGQENISFLKAMNTYGVTLANNHTGDYGDGAIIDTLTLMRENNILCAGAGENIEKAYEAFYIEKDGISISVISVCENEFGIATETQYGSAGYNPRRLLNRINREKTNSDYVIVVFHGGNEFNPLPSPDTVDRYRLICDMGADAVIGGHTHCPQGYEMYNGKPIVYSLGNFLFQSSSEKPEEDPWHYGYMAVLDIKDKISLEIIPYKFTPAADLIKVFGSKDKAEMMNYIDTLSDVIKNEEKLQKYFSGWAWNHPWCPELPPLCENVSGEYNIVHCEAHLSQLKEIFKVYHFENEQEAEEYSKKIIELSKMPV